MTEEDESRERVSGRPGVILIGLGLVAVARVEVIRMSAVAEVNGRTTIVQVEAGSRPKVFVSS